MKIVFESLCLVVISPSCWLNSHLPVKNLNIHDKSTSMSSSYGTNEHIHGFRYQSQYPIDGQVSSQGSIRHKAQFDQCKIHPQVRHITTPSRLLDNYFLYLVQISKVNNRDQVTNKIKSLKQLPCSMFHR